MEAPLRSQRASEPEDAVHMGGEGWGVPWKGTWKMIPSTPGLQHIPNQDPGGCGWLREEWWQSGTYGANFLVSFLSQ